MHAALRVCRTFGAVRLLRSASAALTPRRRATRAPALPAVPPSPRCRRPAHRPPLRHARGTGAARACGRAASRGGSTCSPTSRAAPSAPPAPGALARMRSTPDLNAAISPSLVSAPSGKMPTISPVGQRRVDLVERALHQRRVLARAGDRDRLGGAEDPAHHRDVEDPVVHHEAHRPRDAAGQDQRVHVADVVAHDQRRAFVGHVSLDAVHAQPVQRAHQHPAQEAHQELGHEGEDPDRDQRVGDRQRQEHLRDASSPGSCCTTMPSTAASTMKQRVLDVHAGDHARQSRASACGSGSARTAAPRRSRRTGRCRPGRPRCASCRAAAGSRRRPARAPAPRRCARNTGRA